MHPTAAIAFSLCVSGLTMPNLVLGRKTPVVALVLTSTLGILDGSAFFCEETGKGVILKK